MPDTLSDGGFITGTDELILGGYAYTCDTEDLDLPIAQADAQDRQGLPKGGAFVKGKKKVSVKIKAITGIPAPAQLTPFYQSLFSLPANWWIVTNLKLSAANTGAAIRTYSADIVHHINTPTA